MLPFCLAFLPILFYLPFPFPPCRSGGFSLNLSCFKNQFELKKIKIGFTYHKIHSFESMQFGDFRISIRLYNNHHYLIPEYCHHSSKNIIALSNHSPFSSPSLPSNHWSTFCPHRFACSGYFIKWNHRIWLLSFKIIFSRFRCVLAYTRTSLLFIAAQHHIVWL